MKGFILSFLLFSVTLVNLSYAAKIMIQSQPEGAEIFITTDGSQKPLKVGKTPYDQDLNVLIDTFVKKNQFIITLKKPGHFDYNVLFTKTTNVDINLNVNMKVFSKITQIKDHDLLMIKLFNIQKLIRGKNIGDALIELGKLEEKYADFSIVAELKATAYYINKDVENALSYYRKAFSLNSDNIDAYKMKVYLEKKLGVDSDL